MLAKEALKLAENHIDAGLVVDVDSLRETKFGFYYHVTSEAYMRSGSVWDLPAPGTGGVLVERETGAVHDLGTAFDVDYWLEAYDRGLHLPMDVVVLEIGDRQRAAIALDRLQLTYVVPEIADGVTWTIARNYRQKDFLRSFESLPARFEAQRLIFCMNALDAIADDSDLSLVLEPSSSI